MSTDKQGAKILARTFYSQLRASGYTANQIIGVATELLDLVTEELKDASANKAQAAREEAAPDTRAQA
ncbi:MAG: hypothetical protein FJ086_04775 [Deltaproteobacteria bacterium]|nr:hypothetical protein [Deltaproteobacteria bacterium]